MILTQKKGAVRLPGYALAKRRAKSSVGIFSADDREGFPLIFISNGALLEWE